MSKAGQRCSKKHLSWSFLWNFHKKYSDFGKVTWLQNFLQNIYCIFWISQLCTVYKLKIFSKKYTGEIKKYRIYEFISINTGVMLVFGANIKNRLARLQWIKCFFSQLFYSGYDEIKVMEKVLIDWLFHVVSFLSILFWVIKKFKRHCLSSPQSLAAIAQRLKFNFQETQDQACTKWN